MSRWMLPLLPLLPAACSSQAAQPFAYTGTVEVTEVDVSTLVPGRLARVEVERGDRVERGQELFAIDTEALELELRAREAAVAQAEAAIATAQAQRRAAVAQMRLAERELRRMEQMKEKGAGSEQAVSQLRGQYEAARAQVQALSKGEAQARAARAQAEAAVAGVRYKLEQATVEAPLSGVVLAREREPGEVVGAGMPVLTLGDLEHPRIRVYVPLPVLESLSLGETARVSLDARPDTPIEGRVSWISPEAEFTPRDILTPDERVKQVYAVELELEPAPGLHPGVPAEVRFEADEG